MAAGRSNWPDLDLLEQQSRKLNVVIALLLRVILKDNDFTQKKRKGTGDLAIYLKRQGLEYQDIASILDSPVASVRELVNRGTRKKR
jgi:hypothetical protein